MIDRIQTEVYEWSEDQPWAGQDAFRPLGGATEEVGELIEARNVGTSADVRDAIGDIVIYLCDFAERWGIKLSDAELKDPVIKRPENEEIQVRLARVWHSVLKIDQGIRLEDTDVGRDAELENIGELLWLLDHVAKRYDATLMECVQEAWYGEVQQRDWN